MKCIRADWPAPSGVHALTTTVEGGVSTGPWATLNLGTHVQDDPAAVAENRRRLAAFTGRPQEAIHWLDQVHGTRVLDLDENTCDEREADAAITGVPGRVAVVMTADCLPVAFCSGDGRYVAVAHAGWRGLCAGVLQATVEAFRQKGYEAKDLCTWLGPAIGPQAFEVGEEVREAFLSRDPQAARAFVPSPCGRWMADLYML
ncbi:MAG: peptidoglycan editing factor PgeF, partial [Gammaproteobacteria bacterium]